LEPHHRYRCTVISYRNEIAKRLPRPELPNNTGRHPKAAWPRFGGKARMEPDSGLAGTLAPHPPLAAPPPGSRPRSLRPTSPESRYFPSTSPVPHEPPTPLPAVPRRPAAALRPAPISTSGAWSSRNVTPGGAGDAETVRSVTPMSVSGMPLLGRGGGREGGRGRGKGWRRVKGQVRALTFKAITYQSRQLASNICCVGICPALMIAVSVILGIMVKSLLNANNPDKSYVYCSNVNALDPDLMYPIQDPESSKLKLGPLLSPFDPSPSFPIPPGTPGTPQYLHVNFHLPPPSPPGMASLASLLSPTRSASSLLSAKLPCVQRFSRRQPSPFVDPYTVPANAARSSLPLAVSDATFLPQVRGGWISLGTLQAALTREFMQHQKRVWYLLAVDNGTDPVDVVGNVEGWKRWDENWVDIHISAAPLFNYRLPYFGYEPAVEGVKKGTAADPNATVRMASGLLNSFEARLALDIDLEKGYVASFTQVPYFEMNGTTVTEMDAMLYTRLNDTLYRVARIDKPFLQKANPTLTDLALHLSRVTPLIRSLPHAGIVLHTLDARTLGYRYTLHAGADARIDGGAGFPSRGLRQLMAVAFMDQAILRTSNAAVFGTATISQSVRAMPVVKKAGLEVDVAGRLGRWVYPFGVTFLLPIFVVTLVAEKEAKISVMLRMNGASPWLHDLINYLTFLFLFILSSSIFIATGNIARLDLFLKTQLGILVILFFLWGLTQVSLAFFLAAFFRQSRLALIVTFLTVLCSIIVSIAVDEIFGSSSQIPAVLMVWPPLAFFRGLSLLNVYTLDPALRRYTFARFLSPTEEVRLCCVALLIASPIYLLLGRYFSTILPQSPQHGVPSPWHWPITLPIKWVRRKLTDPPPRDPDSTEELELGKPFPASPLSDTTDASTAVGESPPPIPLRWDSPSNDDPTTPVHTGSHPVLRRSLSFEPAFEDDDVQAERARVNAGAYPPTCPLVIHGIRKVFRTGGALRRVRESLTRLHEERRASAGSKEGGSVERPELGGRDEEDEEDEDDEHPTGNDLETSGGGTRSSAATRSSSFLRRGVKVAVRNFSLALERGVVFGLLGPNGAGKTTLLSILTGIATPTKGTATLDGCDLKKDREKIYRRIGVCPQYDILWDELTVTDHLVFYARLKGVPVSEEIEAARDAIAKVKLEAFANRKSKWLSGGEKRRLSIAIALVGNPGVVFLDEPTTGLDPEVRRVIWNIIHQVKHDKTIILTTHSMEEADVCCQRIGIMSKGILRCLGPQAHLKKRYGAGFRLQFTVDAASGATSFQVATAFVEEVLKMHTKAFRQADVLSTTATYEFEPWAEGEGKGGVAEVCEGMERAREEVGVRDWSINQTTLDDVFVRLISEEIFEYAELYPKKSDDYIARLKQFKCQKIVGKEVELKSLHCKMVVHLQPRVGLPASLDYEEPLVPPDNGYFSLLVILLYFALCILPVVLHWQSSAASRKSARIEKLRADEAILLSYDYRERCEVKDGFIIQTTKLLHDAFDQIECLEAHVESRKFENKELRKQNAASNSEKALLENRNENLSNRIVENDEKIRLMVSDIEKFEKNERDLSNALESAQAETSALSLKTRDLNDENENLKRTIQEMAGQNRALKIHGEMETARADKNAEKVAHAETKIGELEKYAEESKQAFQLKIDATERECEGKVRDIVATCEKANSDFAALKIDFMAETIRADNAVQELAEFKETSQLRIDAIGRDCDEKVREITVTCDLHKRTADKAISDLTQLDVLFKAETDRADKAVAELAEFKETSQLRIDAMGRDYDEKAREITATCDLHKRTADKAISDLAELDVLFKAETDRADKAVAELADFKEASQLQVEKIGRDCDEKVREIAEACDLHKRTAMKATSDFVDLEIRYKTEKKAIAELPKSKTEKGSAKASPEISGESTGSEGAAFELSEEDIKEEKVSSTRSLGPLREQPRIKAPAFMSLMNDGNVSPRMKAILSRLQELQEMGESERFFRREAEARAEEADKRLEDIAMKYRSLRNELQVAQERFAALLEAKIEVDAQALGLETDLVKEKKLVTTLTSQKKTVEAKLEIVKAKWINALAALKVKGLKKVDSVTSVQRAAAQDGHAAKVESLEREVATMKQRMVAVEEEFNRAKEELMANNSKLTDQLLEAEFEIGQVAAMKQRMVAAEEEFNRAKEELTANNSKLTDQLLEAEFEIDELKTAVKTSNMALAVAKSNLRQLNERSEQADSTIVDVERQADAQAPAALSEQVPQLVTEDNSGVSDFAENLGPISGRAVDLDLSNVNALGPFAESVHVKQPATKDKVSDFEEDEESTIAEQVQQPATEDEAVGRDLAEDLGPICVDLDSTDVNELALVAVTEQVQQPATEDEAGVSDFAEDERLNSGRVFISDCSKDEGDHDGQAAVLRQPKLNEESNRSADAVDNSSAAGHQIEKQAVPAEPRYFVATEPKPTIDHGGQILGQKSAECQEPKSDEDREVMDAAEDVTVTTEPSNSASDPRQLVAATEPDVSESIDGKSTGSGRIVGLGELKADEAQNGTDKRLLLAVAREKIKRMREKACTTLLNGRVAQAKKVSDVATYQEPRSADVAEPGASNTIIVKLKTSQESGLGQPDALTEELSLEQEPKLVGEDKPGTSEVIGSKAEDGGNAGPGQLASTEVFATQLEPAKFNVIRTIKTNLGDDLVANPGQQPEADANLVKEGHVASAEPKSVAADEPGASELIDGKTEDGGGAGHAQSASTEVPFMQCEPKLVATIKRNAADSRASNLGPRVEPDTDPKERYRAPAEPKSARVDDLVDRKVEDGGNAGPGQSASIQVPAVPSTQRKPKLVAKASVSNNGGLDTNSISRQQPDADPVKERDVAPAAESNMLATEDDLAVTKLSRPTTTYKGAALGKETSITNPIVLRRLAMAKSKVSAASGAGTGEAGDVGVGSRQ
ncbi:hypothetical protein HDU96_001276, partial [Phlyctochytrium bullatum]